MADKATGGRWSMDALLIEGLDLARYDASLRRDVPLRRAHHAGHGRA